MLGNSVVRGVSCRSYCLVSYRTMHTALIVWIMCLVWFPVSALSAPTWDLSKSIIYSGTTYDNAGTDTLAGYTVYQWGTPSGWLVVYEGGGPWTYYETIAPCSSPVNDAKNGWRATDTWVASPINAWNQGLPPGWTLVDPPGTNSPSTNLVVSANTNDGTWVYVLTNALDVSERLIEMSERLSAVVSNTLATKVAVTTNLSDSVGPLMLSADGRSVFKDTYGWSYFGKWDNDFYSKAWYQDNRLSVINGLDTWTADNRLRVNVDWEGYPGTTNGGTGSWTNFPGVTNNGVVRGNWITDSEGSNYFNIASGSVFKDTWGSVFRDTDSLSVFQDKRFRNPMTENDRSSVFLKYGDKSVFTYDQENEVRPDHPLVPNIERQSIFKDGLDRPVFVDKYGVSVFRGTNNVSYFELIYDALVGNSNGLHGVTNVTAEETDTAATERAVITNQIISAQTNAQGFSEGTLSTNKTGEASGLFGRVFSAVTNTVPKFGSQTDYLICSNIPYIGGSLSVDLGNDFFKFTRVALSIALWLSCGVAVFMTITKRESST